MLRVGLDAWNLGRDRRGIGRYVGAILDAWARETPRSVEVALIVPEWHTWTVARRYRRAAGRMPARVVSRRGYRRARPDVLWFPFNGPSWSAFDGPSVATLHDASTFVLPGFGDDARRTFLAAARRCDAIITDSEFSRTELLRFLDIPPARITAIPLGVAAAEADGSEREDVVLFVGETEERKGIATLLDAMRLLARERPGIGLVIAGRIAGALPPLDGVDVRVLGHVDDGALERLYRTAGVLAYPSRYEGFGLPVLEAMAHGLPVVASDAAGIPEAGGDAALYVPPDDPAALARALLRALGEDERARLRAAGTARARTMTWERTARATAAVLRATAGGRR